MHQVLLCAAQRIAVLCAALVFTMAGALLPVSYARAGVIFDQSIALTGGATTSDIGNVDNKREAADDFVLQAGANTITDVRWWGLYFLDNTPEPNNFTIRIFANDRGSPADTHLYEFAAGDVTGVDTGVNATALGLDVYAYSVVIPQVTLAAGTTYWLSIFNNTPTLRGQYWNWSLVIDAGNDRVRPLNGDWRAFSGKLGFQLADDNLDDGLTVPEPASAALFGAGLAGLGLLRRRRGGRV